MQSYSPLGRAKPRCRSNADYNAMEECDSYTFDCVQLRQFLKDRSITVTGYRLADLLKLVQTTQQLHLPVALYHIRQGGKAKLVENLREIGFPIMDILK